MFFSFIPALCLSTKLDKTSIVQKVKSAGRSFGQKKKKKETKRTKNIITRRGIQMIKQPDDQYFVLKESLLSFSHHWHVTKTDCGGTCHSLLLHEARVYTKSIMPTCI